MTTVTRQITASSIGTAPVSTVTSQHPDEAKAYILLHEKNVATSTTVSSHTDTLKSPEKSAKMKTVSFSNTQSPPPPPARTTSSRNTRPSHKEEVVLRRDQAKQRSPIRDADANANNHKRLSSYSDMEGSVTAYEGASYVRQRSKTETLLTLPSSRDTTRLNSAQGPQGRFNPYTGTMRPIHSKFSVSQPQLNRADLQGFVKPNDRIRKSMFDADQDEQDDGLGEDYGSGYRPTLMKISHGDIQKHAVAVNSPIVPPVPIPRVNRFGSDPNILETNSDSQSVPKTPIPAAIKQEDGVETTNMKERHNSTSSANDTGTLTSSIARAYREYLMEKIDKENHAKSTSPSPSASSSEETAAHGQSLHGNTLSAKIQNITPAQLQALDMPDRAFYPRILPPPSMNTYDGKHEQLPMTVENGGQQTRPVQAFQANTSTSIGGNGMEDVPHTAFTYSTLPRKRHDLNQLQGANMAMQYRTQSVNGLYTPQAGDLHTTHQSEQVQGVGSTLSSHGAVYQLIPQNQGPASLYHSQSQDIPTSGRGSESSELAWQEESSNSHFYSSYSSSLSNASSLSTSTATPYLSDSQTDGSDIGSRMRQKMNSVESSLDWLPRGPMSPQQQVDSVHEPPASSKSLVSIALGKLNGQIPTNVSKKTTKPPPPVMPKPMLPRRNGSTLSSQNIHERSTSDPSLKYAQASATNVSPTISTLSSPHSNRPKHRLHQLSTSLLEIHEANEQEVREVRRPGGSEVKFSDYVSLNSALLPKRVRVSKGFCTGSTEVTMSQGEEFDLHFVQQNKTALMTDPNDVHYTIPLNTMAKFAVVYDPFGVDKVALMGFQFKTAGVLMDLKNPPNVVAATQGFDGGRAESSVEKGEILILDGIKNVFHGRLLKVFSLKQSTMKYLDEKCLGNFTTLPTSVKMTLAQIYEYSISLPQKVMLYPSRALADSIPASLQTNPLLLKRFIMTKSVIATTLAAQSEKIPVSKLPAVSISLNLDVEVNEVSTTERQEQKMCKRTQALLDNFADISVIPYVNMPSTASYAAQCALLQNLDPKLEIYRAETFTPNAITSPPKSRKRSFKSATANGQAAAQSIDKKTESRLKAMETKYESLESKVLEMCEHLKQVSLKVDQVHTYLSKAQSAMNRHKQKLQPASTENRKSSESSSLRHSPSLSDGTAKKSVIHATNSLPNGSNGRMQHPRLRSKYSTESESAERSTSRSPNDDVFVARPSSGIKPQTLPKPNNLKGALLKKAKSNHIRVSRTRSGEKDEKNTKVMASTVAVTDKPDVIKREESSPVISAIPLRKSSSRGSIDLKAYLLEDAPKGKATQSAKADLPNSSSTQEELELNFEEIDAMTDWCSQVEDELTQLYNDSILSVS